MCSGWELKMGTGGNGRHLTRDDDLMGQGPIGYCYNLVVMQLKLGFLSL